MRDQPGEEQPWTPRPALDLPSLGYRIESAVIDTDDGPAEVGRLVMVGETERHVNDILAEAMLKRARKRAGITTTRQGFGQGSVWTNGL